MRSPSRNARSASRASRLSFGASGDGGGGGGFDPSTLVGILSWYRGKDLGAASSSITSWPDQSGRSSNLLNLIGTAPTVATSTPSGGKCANFAANGYLTSVSALRTTGDAAYAVASSQFNTGYRPESILGITGDWASANSTMPNWWKVRLNTAKVVTGYTLDINTSARAPKNWTFEGSNDDSAWTTLDTQTGYSFVGTTGSFSFSNSTAYLYYRITVTLVNTTDLVYLKKVAFTGATLDGTQPSAIETWMVVKTSGTSPLGSPMYTAKLAGLAANGADTLYPHTDTKVYDDYAQVAARPSFTPTLAISGWRLLRIVHSGSARTWYLDNTSQLTEARAAPATGVFWVGRGGVSHFRGAIAEIFTRSQVSDAGEIASLTSYFNTEHGLTVV